MADPDALAEMPREGHALVVTDRRCDTAWYRFFRRLAEGAGVTDAIYDVVMFQKGQTESGIMIGMVAPRDFVIPQNLTGSVGRVRVAPSDDRVFDIQQNWNSIGSAVFPAQSTYGQFTMPSAVEISAGDSFSVWNPDSIDSQMVDVMFGFRFER